MSQRTKRRDSFEALWEDSSTESLVSDGYVKAQVFPDYISNTYTLELP